MSGFAGSCETLGAAPRQSYEVLDQSVPYKLSLCAKVNGDMCYVVRIARESASRGALSIV